MEHRPKLAVATIALLLFSTYAGAAQLGTPLPATDPAYISAQQKYGPNTTVSSASDQNFSSFFPGYELYGVQNTTFTPPLLLSYMAYNRQLNLSYDLSTEINKLLTAAGIVVLTAGKALDLSTLYANLGNVEYGKDKQVVDATASSWLGTPISSPSVTSTGFGWQVNQFTWSRTNGILANWTLAVQRTGLINTSWNVQNASIGPYVFDGNGAVWLTSNNSVITNFTATTASMTAFKSTGTALTPLIPISQILNDICPPLATGTNYDNTTWVVDYVSTNCVPPPDQNLTDLASVLAQTGVTVYNTEVRDWGFTSHNAAGVNTIHILPFINNIHLIPCGIACVLAANVTTIIVYQDFLKTMQDQGFYTNASIHNSSSVALSVIGHEYFHVVEYGIYEEGQNTVLSSAEYTFMNEGLARLAATVMTPIVEHDATSLFYYNANQFMSTSFSTLDPRNLSYAYCLPWAYLFTKDGGLSIVNATMYAAQNASRDNGDVGANSSVSNALAGGAGPHRSFVGFLQDFGQAMNRIRGQVGGQLKWGDVHGNNVFDWGDLLSRTAPPSASSGATLSIHGWGIDFHALPTDGTYDVTVTSSSPVLPSISEMGAAFSTVNLTLGQTTRVDLNGLSFAYVTTVANTTANASYAISFTKVT